MCLGCECHPIRTWTALTWRAVQPEAHWTDFEVAGFGNVLIEMYALVGDVLTFYQDNLARESRLVTATQRKNVMALARMLGYRLRGAQAATAEVVLVLSRPPAAAVTVPAGTIVRTQEVTEPVRFQLLASVVIPAGASPPSELVVVEHSKTHTQLFDARGLAGLEVFLDFGPYLDGSLSVATPQGTFTEVDSFLDSTPNDLHFLVAVDQNDRAAVRFGNGVNGLPPSGTITVTYKTGGGVLGNVDAERIVVVEGSFKDAFGTPVQVSVCNPNAASGGADRQSVASAKLLAPESLRALTRTVARADFEINARRLPGVARALMLTSNEDPSISENSGILYVIPVSTTPGALPTPALKNLVLQQVTEVYPRTLTFQVSVQDPVYRVIDIVAGPDETGVPIDSTIVLELVDTGTDGVDRSSVRIWVDDALAFEGGEAVEIAPAYAGPLSGVTQTADTLRVVLHPVTPLGSLATVTFRVTAQTLGGGAALDETYSFVVEDRTAPRVVGAQATTQPGHTHFVDLVEPLPVVEPNHWELGFSELGVTPDLH